VDLLIRDVPNELVKRIEKIAAKGKTFKEYGGSCITRIGSKEK